MYLYYKKGAKGRLRCISGDIDNCNAFVDKLRKSGKKIVVVKMSNE